MQSTMTRLKLKVSILIFFIAIHSKGGYHMHRFLSLIINQNKRKDLRVNLLDVVWHNHTM